MALTKNNLSTNELLVLNLEMNKREKSLVLAYLMLLVGHLGVHRFYLKKIATGIVQLCLSVFAFVFYFVFVIALGIESVESPDSTVSMLFLIPVVLFGLALTVWVIVDACLLPGMVREWNERLENQLIAQIAAARSANRSDGTEQPQPNGINLTK